MTRGVELRATVCLSVWPRKRYLELKLIYIDDIFYKCLGVLVP